MANNMSNYLENALGNGVLRNTQYTVPTTVYLALLTGDPGEAGTMTTEVTTSGSAYVRKAITFGAPTDGVFTNSADVTFDTSTSAWGTIAYFAIMDASTSGNCLFYGPLTSSKVMASGDVIKFVAGQISVTFA